MEKIVFVVDDSPTCLSTAEEALEGSYRVITLSSAVKMFMILEKIVPDLILLDIDMPEMDGFEAIKQLKANAKYAEVPVIFLTGLTDKAHEIRAIELGALDFIIKPLSEPILLKRLKNYLGIEAQVRERTKHLRERIEQLERDRKK